MAGWDARAGVGSGVATATAEAEGGAAAAAIAAVAAVAAEAAVVAVVAADAAVDAVGADGDNQPNMRPTIPLVCSEDVALGPAAGVGAGDGSITVGGALGASTTLPTPATSTAGLAIAAAATGVAAADTVAGTNGAAGGVDGLGDVVPNSRPNQPEEASGCRVAADTLTPAVPAPAVRSTGGGTATASHFASFSPLSKNTVRRRFSGSFHPVAARNT